MSLEIQGTRKFLEVKTFWKSECEVFLAGVVQGKGRKPILNGLIIEWRRLFGHQFCLQVKLQVSESNVWNVKGLECPFQKMLYFEAQWQWACCIFGCYGDESEGLNSQSTIVWKCSPDNVALSMASGQRLWKSLCSLPHQKHIIVQDHRDIGWQERKLQEIYEEFPAGISLSHMKGSEILGMFRMHVNECSVKVTVDERNNGSVILTLACHTQNVLHDCCFVKS
jgi:hypothetical protein